MTIRAQLFTPEILLSAPRRSAGVPNAAGTSILYTTSTYDFNTHEQKNELRCLDVESRESKLLTTSEGIGEPVWLEDYGDEEEEATVFAYLKSGGESSSSDSNSSSKTELIIASISQVDDQQPNSYIAGTIPAPASDLKVAKLRRGAYAVVLAAQAGPDGSLFDPQSAPRARSTAKLFDGGFVRHWDAYIGTERNVLFYGVLEREDKAKGEEKSEGKDKGKGRYKLSRVVNALKGSGLESPIPPFGGTDCFDVSKR